MTDEPQRVLGDTELESRSCALSRSTVHSRKSGEDPLEDSLLDRCAVGLWRFLGCELLAVNCELISYWFARALSKRSRISMKRSTIVTPSSSNDARASFWAR
jgi:hypothetical protein